MTSPPDLPDSDDDGNPLALPAADSDVGQLIYLLEWARLRGFRVGPMIQVGGLIVQACDLRQTDGRRDKDDVFDRGPWVEAGHDE